MESSETTRLQIPGYQVLDVRGVGAMATVYHARQESLGREVALKVLHPGVAADDDYRERFLREARAAARLNHESIVRAYEAGVHDGTYWLAMEYVQGEDLSERLDHEGSLSEPEGLRIAIQVCKALQAAADFGLVHRDVKPENILLGDDGIVKLADLGLAKVQEDGSGTVTAEGISVGTVAFFSPEQCRGKRDLDIRSDLFALGGTLYAMITGELPYGRGDNPPVTMKRILEEWPPELDDPTKFSPSVREAVKFLMAKRRDDRPEDARAAASMLREALRRLDESQVGPMRPLSDSTADARGERQRKRARRRRGVLTRAPAFPAGAFLAALLLTTLVFAGMVLSRGGATPQPSRPVTRQPAPRLASVPSPQPSQAMPAATSRPPVPPPTRAPGPESDEADADAQTWDWRSGKQLESWDVSGSGSRAGVEGGRLHFEVQSAGRLDLEEPLLAPLELSCDLRVMPAGARAWLTLETSPGEGWATTGDALYRLEQGKPLLLAGQHQPSAQRHRLRVQLTQGLARGWLDGVEQFRQPISWDGSALHLGLAAEHRAQLELGPLTLRSGEGEPR